MHQEAVRVPPEEVDPAVIEEAVRLEAAAEAPGVLVGVQEPQIGGLDQQVDQVDQAILLVVQAVLLVIQVEVQAEDLTLGINI